MAFALRDYQGYFWLLCILLLAGCSSPRPSENRRSTATVLLPSVTATSAISVARSPIPVTTTTPSTAASAGTPTLVPINGNAQNLELVGHIGGSTTVIDVEGDYAYVGIGAELVILNISIPTSVTQVGSVLLPGVARCIDIADQYAYVATGDSGLRIVDISDVAAPKEVGHCELPGFVKAVEVTEGYAYLAAEDAGLWRVDVSDPTAPIKVTSFGTFGAIGDVTVVDNIVYAAGYATWNGQEFVGNNGIYAINISDPVAMEEVGFHNTSESPVKRIVAKANYLYAITGWDQMPGSANAVQILSIDEPENPVVQSVVNLGNFVISNIAVENRHAFVITQACDYMYTRQCRGWLEVIDVFDVTAPVWITEHVPHSCSISGLSNGIVVVGDQAYIAAGGGGLQVCDVADPAAVKGRGGFGYPGQGSIQDVAVASNYAVLAAGYSGLRIVDVSSPVNPLEVAHYNQQGTPRSVAVMGKHAYVANVEGLQIFNMADPTAPEEIGFLDTPGLSLSLAVAGDYAYLTDIHHQHMVGTKQSGLRVIDISNPAGLVEAGMYNSTMMWPSALVVVGKYAYLTATGEQQWAGENKDMEIVDVSDPNEPIALGSIDLPGNSMLGVAVANNYAYVAAGKEGLRVVNVSDRTSPVEVSFYDRWSANAMDVCIAGHLAYVAAGQAGLRVLDISNPSNLVEIGFYNTPGYAESVTVVGEYIYVADGDGGLIILH